MVGQQAEPRKAYAYIVGRLLRIRVDRDGNPVQQPGLFERLAATQNGMADNRVMCSVIPWCQGVQDSLPLQESQGTKTCVGEEDVVGDTKLGFQALWPGNVRLDGSRE